MPRILPLSFVLIFIQLCSFGTGRTRAADICVKSGEYGFEAHETSVESIGATTIGFCLKQDCYRLDRRARRYAKWPAGKPVDPSREWKAEDHPSVESVAGGVRICAPGKKDCRVIRLKQKEMWIDWERVGSSLLLRYARCAGPCEAGMLFTIDGRFIAHAGGKEGYVIGAGGRPRAAGGDVFAFAEAYGTALVFQNVKTGRVVRRIDMAPVYKRNGIPAEGGNPESARLLPPSAGTLVLFLTGPVPGAAALFDLRTRKLTGFIKPRICDKG